MTFKNTISFLVFVLFLQTYSFAQTDWQWGKRGGSNGGGYGSGDNELVEDIATDIYGNVYVLANNNRDMVTKKATKL
jgi:hypothetical protein